MEKLAWTCSSILYYELCEKIWGGSPYSQTIKQTHSKKERAETTCNRVLREGLIVESNLHIPPNSLLHYINHCARILNQNKIGSSQNLLALFTNQAT